MKRSLWIVLLCLLLAAMLSASIFAESDETVSDSLEGSIAPEEGLSGDTLALLGHYDSGTEPSFGASLLRLLLQSLTALSGKLRGALVSCAVILAGCMICGLLGASQATERISRLIGTLVVCTACFGNLSSMVGLAIETVNKAGEYSMVLLPSLSSLGFVSGADAGNTALCTGAVFFLNLSLNLCRTLVVPILWMFCAVSAADTVLEQGMLTPMRDFLKWLAGTLLKWTSYLFTGYLSVTGILSGSAGAVKRRIARTAISNAVPMVGGILSESSDAFLAAASVIRSSAGVYGMLAVAAICLQPFLQIGVQMLLLKACAAISGVFGQPRLTALVQRFSEAMGLLLGLCGSFCLAAMLSIALCIKAVGL